MGALCESCDIYGVKWNENWSSSELFKCGKCSEVTNNAFKIFFISLYTLIALFYSVKSTKIIVESYIISFYL